MVSLLNVSNEEESRRWLDKKREASAYMVADYEGAKGPGALGPLFLEDGSFPLLSLSLFLTRCFLISLLPSSLATVLSSLSHTLELAARCSILIPFRLVRSAPTAIPNYLCFAYVRLCFTLFRLFPLGSNSLWRHA